MGTEPQYPLDRRLIYTGYMSTLNKYKHIYFMTLGFFKHPVLLLVTTAT
jgi:hypothetical protein